MKILFFRFELLITLLSLTWGVNLFSEQSSTIHWGDTCERMKQVIKFADTNKLEIHDPSGFFLKSILNANKILSFEVFVKDESGQRSEFFTGKEVFKFMLEHFGDKVNKIENEFRADAPEMLDNLNSVNKEIAKGVPLKDAILKSWSGKVTAEEGYTEIDIRSSKFDKVTGEYTYIQVHFTKPTQ